MASYIVTDNQIRNFLLLFLEFDKDNTNNDKADRLNSSLATAVKKFLETLDNVDNLKDPSYEFNEKDRKRIIDIINEFEASDGSVVSFPQVTDEIKFFEDSPNEIPILDSIVNNFLIEAKKIDVNTHFPGHELSFRFYIGHEKALSSVSKNKYGIVVVPICSPKVAVGVTRDHTKDLENQLFIKHKEHLALAISDLAKGVIKNDTDTCRRIAENKDHLSDTELTYFSLFNFDRFRSGLDASRRDSMSVTFSRKNDKSGPVSLIITFLDRAKNPLESSFLLSGIKTYGVFFNQGDLVPPPKPVSDKSF